MELRFNQDDRFFAHDGITPAPGDDDPILPESDEDDEDDEEDEDNEDDPDIEDLLEEDGD